MMENSKIEWTDHTFNPWIGCTKISPACDGCYAEALMDLRHRRVKWGGARVRTGAANWHQPIKWNRAAAAAGTRPRVFCASLADVFDNQVPPEWRADLFELIRITPNLLWLLLTKRPQNIVKMVHESGAVAGNGTRYLPRNVALGTTVEDQRRTETNVPHLLYAKELTGAPIAFVSCEPLLGSIDLRRIGGTLDALAGHDFEAIGDIRDAGVLSKTQHPPRIDWVIAGGETDQGKHKARVAHPDWFRSLRDQCEDVGTAFLFKQWGNWHPEIDRDRDDPDWQRPYSDYREPHFQFVNLKGGRGFHGERVHVMRHCSKASAGRRLDGREHNGVPSLPDLRAEFARQAAPNIWLAGGMEDARGQD